MIKSEQFQKYSKIIFVCILIALILSIGILSYVPPVSRDALTHHLAIPKLWIEHGGIYEIPSLLFSYYPMNIELLYLIPLYFGNDIIPKCIHFSFALGTAWLIFSYLKKRTNHMLSLLGVLLFLSTPVIVKLSISAYVDLGLVFFSWATIFYLFAWIESRYSPKYFIFSAIFCGMGMGTKYNGMIVLVLLTLFVPVVYIRTVSKNKFKKKWAIGYPILFFLIAITFFSPWMIRNLSLTGNPIYPLYNNRINEESDDTAISNMSMKPWLQRKLIYQETAIDTALIPIRIFFQGQDDNPRFFDGKLNPALFLFPILFLIPNRKMDGKVKFEQFFLASFAILYLLYASFMVDMRIRYIAPIIPPLVILTVMGIGNVMQWIESFERNKNKALCRLMVVIVLSCFVLMNVRYIVGLFKSVNPVPYVLGETSREAYLLNKLPDYPAIQFVNQIKFDDVKLLALFLGKRLYYFNKPVEFNMNSFATKVAHSTSARNLSNILRKDGYTHFIVGVQYFEYWANQSLNNDQKKIVSEWFRKDCQLLFSKNGYAVFQMM